MEGSILTPVSTTRTLAFSLYTVFLKELHSWLRPLPEKCIELAYSLSGHRVHTNATVLCCDSACWLSYQDSFHPPHQLEFPKSSPDVQMFSLFLFIKTSVLASVCCLWSLLSVESVSELQDSFGISSRERGVM